MSVQKDPSFVWGYYNWGIGLAEQGCRDDGAAGIRRGVAAQAVGLRIQRGRTRGTRYGEPDYLVLATNLLQMEN
jgi:hypothetical protein